MTSAAVLNVAVVIVAVVAAAGLVRFSRSFWQIEGTNPKQVRVLGAFSPVLTWLKYRWLPSFRTRAIQWEKARQGVFLAAELVSIVVFAAWVGREFLQTPDTRWPVGADFALNVQGYFGWLPLRQCGLCVLWNGSINGGTPLFTELLAAVAHPVIVALILLWGVIAALKVTLVVALAVAGLAQWWLARLLGLGWVARLWSAAMAVVGGHLAARMDDGLVEAVFSAAWCSLVIPAALYLAEAKTRRAAVVLGLVTASALLAGQGYMQLGLLLAIFPATLILFVQSDFRLSSVWRLFVLAGVLALLLAAVYWVPFLHFFPNFEKVSDATFDSVQPLAFLPLNLVINNHDFYRQEVLDKMAWAFLYANYIGWVPVLLALAALRLVPLSGRRRMVFLIACAVLVYIVAAAIPFRLLMATGLTRLADLAAGVRFPSMASSLAVPPILALAAWGLDRLLHMRLPRLQMSFPSGFAVGLSLAWLWVVPLTGALNSAYQFGRGWLATFEVPADTQRLAAQLAQPDTAWVQPPFDDWPFVVLTLQDQGKLTHTYRPWNWRNVEPPPPVLMATRDELDPSVPGYLGRLEYVSVVAFPNEHYAFVETSLGRVPCHATALGGNIDVTCVTSEPGRLVVQEHWLAGWGGTLDGRRLTLTPGAWLSADLPAGTHTVSFRYRPWDVAVGLLLTLVGLGLAVYWWRRPAAAAGPPPPSAPEPAAGPDPLPAA